MNSGKSKGQNSRSNEEPGNAMKKGKNKKCQNLGKKEKSFCSSWKL